MNSITEKQLRAMLAASDADDRPGQWIAPLNVSMQAWDISTPLRQSVFLAQVLHESSELRHLEEGLSYSTPRLRQVFPTHFTSDEEAARYSRQPEKLANRVYANRMGNGNEASGDGWRYRGRGLIQLTGRESYAGFSKAALINALINPDLLTQAPAAAQSAGWFWATHRLNELADRSADADGGTHFVTITRRINGGTNGLLQRQAYWVRVRQALGLFDAKQT